MKNLKRILFLAIVGLFMTAPLSSCRKKADTIARIIVRESSGGYVSGATVRLYAEPTDPNNPGINENWDDFSTTTNSAGIAEFNFNEIYQLGQAGVAVANIEASKGGATGTGVIKVEQETTSEETVFI